MAATERFSRQEVPVVRADPGHDEAKSIGGAVDQSGASAIGDPHGPDRPALPRRPASAEGGSNTVSLHGATIVPTRKPIDWGVASWRLRAACQGTASHLFFPTGATGVAADQTQEAKAVCQSCRVREACLQFALETNQEAGIWGGTSEEERRRLRTTWLIGRRRRVVYA